MSASPSVGELSPELYCTDSKTFRILNNEQCAKSIGELNELLDRATEVSCVAVARSRLVPLALLLAYGLGFGASAFGFTLPAFDDHPGQVYRLWHVLTRGPAPWAWNPGWWTGYPEMQFYPPGFFYVGLLLRWLSLGALSPNLIYQVLLWLTWLAPGVTVYVLLLRAIGNGWLALPGSLVALTLSTGVASGVEGGVHIGMLPARLGWALLPLLALVLIRWADDEGSRPWGLALISLAAIVVTHPAHVPAAAVLVLVTALSAPGSRARRLRVAGGDRGSGCRRRRTGRGRSHARALAAARRLAVLRGDCARLPARGALGSAPHGAGRACPVREVERATGLRPRMVAAPLPRHGAHADPHRARDRQRHLHASLAGRQARVWRIRRPGRHHHARRARGRSLTLRPRPRQPGRDDVQRASRSSRHQRRGGPRRGSAGAQGARRRHRVHTAPARRAVHHLRASHGHDHPDPRRRRPLEHPGRRPTRRMGVAARGLLSALARSPQRRLTCLASRAGLGPRSQARRRARSCRAALPRDSRGDGSDDDQRRGGCGLAGVVLASADTRERADGHSGPIECVKSAPPSSSMIRTVSPSRSMVISPKLLMPPRAKSERALSPWSSGRGRPGVADNGPAMNSWNEKLGVG